MSENLFYAIHSTNSKFLNPYFGFLIYKMEMQENLGYGGLGPGMW